MHKQNFLFCAVADVYMAKIDILMTCNGNQLNIVAVLQTTCIKCI